MSVVAATFMIVGALLNAIGGIGVVRFGDLMSRIHAAAKAPTLGLLLIAVGAAIEIDSGAATATLVLVVRPAVAHVAGCHARAGSSLLRTGRDRTRRPR